MNYWRVAGGTALGAVGTIGAVTLLPVFGAVGAITAVGVGVSALVGGGAGAAASLATDDEEAIEAAKRTAREDGRNEAKASFDKQLRALQDALKLDKLHAHEQKRYHQLTEALYTVGVAALAQCNCLTEDEILNVKEFAFGAAHGHRPKAIVKAMADIEANPPNLKTARARALKLAPQNAALFDQMMQVVAASVDPDRHYALLSTWTQLRAA
jgi:hypothetical protein